MTAQALYRRWRSRTFEEVLGQEHVTRTLRNALLSGRIAHAYLFAGPRGTGKTTMARLLAKAVNCLSRSTASPKETRNPATNVPSARPSTKDACWT
jgi:DNA polymerase-3 subunit gamma/tau